MTITTIADLQARCEALAKRIGPLASVTATIGHELAGGPYLAVRISGSLSEFFDANPSWEAALMKAETSVRTAPDPEAEYASWLQTAAE